VHARFRERAVLSLRFLQCCHPLHPRATHTTNLPAARRAARAPGAPSSAPAPAPRASWLVTVLERMHVSSTGADAKVYF